MPYKKREIVCKVCLKAHLASRPNVLFCSSRCSNLDREIKKPDGFLSCEICSKQMPYRNTLIARSTKYAYKKTARFCSTKCSSYWRNILNNPAQTAEGRLKISKSAIKRGTYFLLTKQAREKQKKSISGNGHWNWQGGITSENKRRRNLAEYKQWRSKIFARDDYTCQICRKRGGELNADHIKPWSLYPKLRLKLSNGRTLCVECHKNTDTYMGRIKNYSKTGA